jgi:hypothetical protein
MTFLADLFLAVMGVCAFTALCAGLGLILYYVVALALAAFDRE